MKEKSLWDYLATTAFWIALIVVLAGSFASIQSSIARNEHLLKLADIIRDVQTNQSEQNKLMEGLLERIADLEMESDRRQ